MSNESKKQTTLQLKVAELNQMTPMQIVENEIVEQKFVTLYDAIHGSNHGQMIYEKEKFNFMKLISENTDLQQSTRVSLYGCFLDMAVNGLGLDQTGRPLCYIIARSVKSGRKAPDGKDVYEKRAGVNVTGYGEVVMRMRAGQIRHCDNPIIVYEGDVFQPELDELGNKKIKYKPLIPRKAGTKIIGAFIKITRNDGTTDFQWMLEDDIERLKGFSSRANSKYENGQRVAGAPNALYSSNKGQIDTGFLENKMIKHAFDSYPKVRTGDFSKLETNDAPDVIDYGLNQEDTDEPTSFGQVETDDQQVETITIQPAQEEETYF